MKRKRYTGELEIAILNCLRILRRASVGEVCNSLKEKCKYTTILTVMHRLFEKGELKREKVGRHYEYWIDQKHQTENGLLKRLKEKIFGGNSVEMIAYFLEMDDRLSSEELEEIASLIEQQRTRG